MINNQSPTSMNVNVGTFNKNDSSQGVNNLDTDNSRKMYTRNRVSNQKDVKIDLRQFLEEEKQNKYFTDNDINQKEY